MKSRAIANTILGLLRNALIMLMINIVITLLIYSISDKKSSYQFGVTLGIVGAVYFLPLLGFLSKDFASKSSMAFDSSLIAARTERKQSSTKDISMTIKGLIYGVLTLSVSYLFITGIIKF